jgi:hypothetical protein
MTARAAPDSLPLGSSLFLVLDGTISSRSTAGTVVRAHLRDPVVVGGVTIAAAGAPVDVEITQAYSARTANQDGFVDIYIEPLRLSGGASLPLVTPTSHIDPHVSAGQSSTRAVTDTVSDILIPGAFLYHLFRKGRDVTLRPGTIIRARTAESVEMTGGQLTLATPPPFDTSTVLPHPAFTVAPMYTPPGFQMPTPKPKPSVTPTATPSPTP